MLKKWNSLLYAQSQPTLALFPEGSAPASSDNEQRSLQKITALVAAVYAGPEPSFYPEGGLVQSSDDEKRSLVKIADSVGATALASDSEQLLYQKIAAVIGTSGPSFVPEHNTVKTTDDSRRSLWKIVAGSGGSSIPAQVTDISASWSGPGADLFAVSWAVPTPLGAITEVKFQKWNADYPTRGAAGDGWEDVATITSNFPTGSYFFTDVEAGDSMEFLSTVKVRMRYTNTVGVGPWSNEATVADLSGLSNVPTVIDGALRLRANDGTWHDVSLTGEHPDILFTIDQSNAADPGWRWYAVMEDQSSNDFTFGLIQNADGDYVFDTPRSTSEDPEYTVGSPLILTSPDEEDSFDYLAGQFAVSFYTDGEGTRVSIDVPDAGSPPSVEISDLSAVIDGSVVLLVWSETFEVSDNNLTHIYRSINGGAYVDIATVTGDSGNYGDTSPEASDAIGFAQPILYKVRNQNDFGNGPYSNVATAT